ncbi:SH3 domain-containing protein [Brucellaceae bacterium C25G]
MLLYHLIGSPKRAFRITILGLSVVIPTVGYAAPALVTGNVNVREGASSRYNKVATLRPGWHVDAGPCQAGWCHVRVGGIYGWASARFLSFNTHVQQIVRPAPYYAGRPDIIIETGPIFGRQPYWRHHYHPPYRPAPSPSVPFYNPYRVHPSLGPGPVYPPMRNVPIGEGVSPVGR